MKDQHYQCYIATYVLWKIAGEKICFTLIAHKIRNCDSFIALEIIIFRNAFVGREIRICGFIAL